MKQRHLYHFIYDSLCCDCSIAMNQYRRDLIFITARSIINFRSNDSLYDRIDCFEM